MYHSVYFGSDIDLSDPNTFKNTWDDWHLVSPSRPVLNPPTQKTKYLDIPGADSAIDLSTSLTGYPIFNNREGSLEFLIMNGYQPWNELYSNIMNYLHGKKMRIILEDDKEYFYEGRLIVKEWKEAHPWSSIVINYNVNPYKWSIESSIEDWKWDPFNFRTGKILPAIFKDITINSSKWVEKAFEAKLFDSSPICPEFIVTDDNGQGLDISYTNEIMGVNIERHLNSGSNFLPEFIFYGQQSYTVRFKGTGTVSMKFRNGRL